MTQARTEGRAMVQEAQELRARVLADLSRRRRVLHSQIEQLRAGRERLAETISEVRHSVDRITDELFRAEDEARLAAEAAGRQALAQEEGLSRELDEHDVPLREATSSTPRPSTGAEAIDSLPADAGHAAMSDGDDQPMPAQAWKSSSPGSAPSASPKDRIEADQARDDRRLPDGGARVTAGGEATKRSRGPTASRRGSPSTPGACSGGPS